MLVGVKKWQQRLVVSAYIVVIQAVKINMIFCIPIFKCS